MIEYLRECGRLLKWVFFQPSKLRAHIRQIAPSCADIPIPVVEWLLQVRSNAKLRRLQIQALLVIVVLPFAGDLLVKLSFTAVGYDFNWAFNLYWVAFVVIAGVAICAAGGIEAGVLLAITYGVTSGIVFGSPVGLQFGITVNLKAFVTAMTFVVTLRPLIGITVAVAFSIIFSTMLSLMAGLANFPRLGIPGNTLNGITIGVAGFLAGTKFLFYAFEIWPGIKAYYLSLNSESPDQEFLRSPIVYDEAMIWPQPYLSSLLLRIYEKHPDAGLLKIGKVACMPFQRWAGQKALRIILENEPRPFFVNLDRLLTSPEPYMATSFARYERERESDKYFATKLILAELMNRWPKARWGNQKHWPSDWLPRAMTFWLRRHGVSPYAELAEVYFRLLHQTPLILERLTGSDGDNPADLGEDDFWDIPWILLVLKESRELPNGEEFYQWLRLAECGLRCGGLQQVSKLRDEFMPLFEIEAPLRPQIVTVFRRLRDATQDASAFLTGEHELTRKDALLKAGGVLEEARQLANEVYEPERSLLLAVIEHWRRMFAIEGGRVAEQREVEVLPNPYVAGRPIRPEDGRLFVGRRDEFRSIEEKLQTGVGLVVWGQRRIGKTSMLLHLPGHLSHDLLPVYLNLQMLMANTTSGFLYAVAREIVKQFNVRSPAFSRNPSDSETIPPEGGTTNFSLPSAEEFAREPYLSFNRLLEDVERQLQPGQQVVLSFDEFESLEERVKSGKIEPEIFAYLRGVTQTGRGFALLFAGLHTLEQMTREYWNPFFASVQTIRVSYLSELDAEQLITDPIEQFPLDYEYEAIKRITELTRSHAYLTQSLCHNLVNRLNDPLHRSQKAKREDVDAVIEKTLESSGYYFDDFVWGWSKENERIALSLLAEVEGEAAFAVVEKHLGREAALEATRKLVGRDILSERTGETGELVFRFQIPLARMWVQRMKPSARILMEGGKQ